MSDVSRSDAYLVGVPAKRRVSVVIPTVVALVVMLLAACVGRDKNEAGQSPATTDTSRESVKLQKVGPLGELRWSGSVVPDETLLHDDGTTLSVVHLDGRRDVIWEHPEAAVSDLAVSGDGRRIAAAVNLLPEGEKDLASVLYLLEDDGSVSAVDAVDDFRFVSTPVFIRRDGIERLYWVRFSEEIEEVTLRYKSELMALTEGGGAERQDIAIRYDEGVAALDSFPGEQATIHLIRRVVEPTWFEVFLLHDGSGLSLRHRANTDAPNGVAWLTPSDYVIPVAQEDTSPAIALWQFRLGCEYEGAMLLYEGDEVAPLGGEIGWDLLAYGDNAVLVLTAEDTWLRDEHVSESQVFWHIARGLSLEKSPIQWRAGAWTAVPRRTSVAAYGDCDEYAPVISPIGGSVAA